MGAGKSGGGKELLLAMAAMASTAVLSASRLQKASEGVGKELGIHSRKSRAHGRVIGMRDSRWGMSERMVAT